MRKGNFLIGTLILAMALVGTTQAGLWDPGIINRSFESPDISPYWGNWVDSWFDDSYWGTFMIDDTNFPTTYPETPYGTQWGGVDGATGVMWQQIGTYEEGLEVPVSLLACQRAGQDWATNGGLTIAIYAGGTGAADDTTPLSIGATLLDSTVVQPFTEAGMLTAPVAVTLNSGTGMTVGDPLWLALEGAGATGQHLFDNVQIPEPATLMLLGLGGLGLIRRRK
jgi:hypothetical protein